MRDKFIVFLFLFVLFILCGSLAFGINWSIKAVFGPFEPTPKCSFDSKSVDDALKVVISRCGEVCKKGDLKKAFAVDWSLGKDEAKCQCTE